MTRSISNHRKMTNSTAHGMSYHLSTRINLIRSFALLAKDELQRGLSFWFNDPAIEAKELKGPPTVSKLNQFTATRAMASASKHSAPSRAVMHVCLLLPMSPHAYPRRQCDARDQLRLCQTPLKTTYNVYWSYWSRHQAW